MSKFDFAVIGAGMAGASVAARLAPRSRVLLLEREAFAAYHSTGRSAALFSPLYGNAAIGALTRASREFFDGPPAGFAEHPLLTPRGVIYTAGEDARVAVERLLASPLAQPLAVDAAVARVPVLRRDALACAAFEAGACDIDVHALHQGFLRLARAEGATVMLNAEITALERGDGWRLSTRNGAFEAAVLIDAAGAWADELARLAGVAPLSLRPLRRTAINVDAPAGVDVHGWPCVIAADESFYFKPDAGRLLASPADETPSEPCDAQPEALDIAVCVDRLERATTLDVRRVAHAWAGLRTFAADRTPVVGYDPDCADFFWLAGQGGYGIQTAPALSEVAAALALREPIPAYVADRGLIAEALAPGRLRAREAAPVFL